MHWEHPPAAPDRPWPPAPSTNTPSRGTGRTGGLTQWVRGGAFEDDAVGGEEDGSLGRQQGWATDAAPRGLLPLVGHEVHSEALHHALLAHQQVGAQQLWLRGCKRGGLGPRRHGRGLDSPAQHQNLPHTLRGARPIPSGWEEASCSPCARHPASRCASAQYLQTSTKLGTTSNSLAHTLPSDLPLALSAPLSPFLLLLSESPGEQTPAAQEGSCSGTTWPPAPRQSCRAHYQGS